MNQFYSHQNFSWKCEWEGTNWEGIRERVHTIQSHIYYAAKNNDIETVRNLQLQLANDYYAKLLAVKVVTQENSGKNAPGIDGLLVLNEEEKFFLASNLVIDGTTNYIKRVYIPKSGTLETRPLGIPTIADRAKQCLCKFIIEPEFEARFETNSFGFRPGRSQIDAISKIRSHLIFNGPCYVLDADIKKCFDRISHDVLMRKINGHVLIQTQLLAWLRAGIFDKDEVIFVKEGTPQGGVISPLLANIAIDGLQKAISDGIYFTYGPIEMKRTYFCRYADDLVVLHPRQDILLLAKSIIEQNLALMSLELKDEKTRVIRTLETYVLEGKMKVKSQHFDFLGFRFKQRLLSKHIIRKEGGKLSNIRTLVLVSPDRIRRHKASITALLKRIGNVEEVILKLNPRIIGWCNYFKHSDAKEYGDLPRKMDLWLNSKLRKWVRKTTKLRGKVPKFWKQDTKDWILFHINDIGKEITLVKYNSFKWRIFDYKSIPSSQSPYMFTYEQLKALQNRKDLMGNS